MAMDCGCFPFPYSVGAVGVCAAVAPAYHLRATTFTAVPVDVECGFHFAKAGEEGGTAAAGPVGAFIAVAEGWSVGY